MQFSVNYSPMLAEMVNAGQVQVDVYKCPAWPDLLKQARASRPVYVHSPLLVGGGRGVPMDAERKQGADLEFYADLLAATSTPLLNTHLFPAQEDYPDLPADSLAAAHARRLIDGAKRDLEPLIARFGAEHVTVENCIPEAGRPLLLAAPEVLNYLLEETGCGFLLDISHARLAAGVLGMDERAYLAALPVQKIREVHITGIQRIEGRWVELLRDAGDAIWNLETMAGRMQDHLPMTESDWVAYRWVMEQIRADGWGRPWVVAYEYGGVGGFWDVLCDREVYGRDLPALRAVIYG